MNLPQQTNSGSLSNMGALGYTSPILWHFFGRKKQASEKLEVLQKILKKEKLLIKPPGWKEKRVEIFPSEQPMSIIEDDSPPPKLEPFYFEEPKMVCMADIPIHCLQIHALRYGNFGLGLSLTKLKNIYPDDLRTVMLFRSSWAIDSQKELKRSLLKSNKQTKSVFLPKLNIAKFIKFESCSEGDECFENIYLEREWRSIVDIDLRDNLDMIVVPRAFLNDVMDIMRESRNNYRNPISVLAWESLFGVAEESR